MLRSVEVNNFKSLSGFRLEINEGLNILVGPNGAGKSNILNFFEFLSYLTEETVSSSVSYVGGAGSVFRRESRENQFGDIDFAVEGESTRLPPQSDGRRRRVKYRYEAKVQLNDSKDRIYFSKQLLEISAANSKGKYTRLKSGKIKIDARFEFHTENDGVDTSFSIDILDKRKFNPNIETLTDERPSEILSFNRGVDVAVLTQNTIMSELYRFIPDINAILNDLNRGRVFNIDPHKTRKPEELTQLPGLSPDGSGLAATLYHLKERNVINRRTRFRPTRAMPQFINRPRAFKEITEYIRAINPDIVGIDIETNSIENYVRILIELESREGTLRVPLTLASDGTVKWIALVTAVVTNRSIFAIEEPENFLHPNMQTEIVRIMRESTQSGPIKKFVLMTTHSETLLNAVEPGEVIVVRMVGGKTEVRRSDRISELRSLIHETGFGVGHMYVTGMLDN